MRPVSAKASACEAALPEKSHPMSINAYAVQSASTPFAPFSIERRAPGPKDVAIDILYCGVCHSDLHTARGEWPGTRYPCVPGHEIIGRVTAVGGEVTKFQVGELVGVGCMVDSCRHCFSCEDGLEQYCEQSASSAPITARSTAGREHLWRLFRRHRRRRAFRADRPPCRRRSSRRVAPLLCAGITTWSPLRHWKVGPGKKVGIVGIGGLGHMGVKLAHALGAHVVAFTTSAIEARRRPRAGRRRGRRFDRRGRRWRRAPTASTSILNTVAVSHNLDAYTNLLKRDGTLMLVGVPATPHPSPAVGALIFKRAPDRRLADRRHSRRRRRCSTSAPSTASSPISR